MKTYNLLNEVMILNNINIYMNIKPIRTIINNNCVIYEYDDYIKIYYNNRIQFNYRGLKLTIQRDDSERAKVVEKQPLMTRNSHL